MIRNKPARRALAVILIVLGALLIFLAPAVWIGIIPFVLGVLLEIVGIAVEHRAE